MGKTPHPTPTKNFLPQTLSSGWGLMIALADRVIDRG